MRQVQSVVGPMWVHDQDHLGQVLESGAFWDGQLKGFLDEAPEGSLVIDIGANVGFFSVYLAQRGHPVVAVEAWPDTAALLRLNTGALSIRVLEGVAYDRECAFTLAPGAFLGWPPSPQSPNVSSYAFLPDPWHGTIPGLVLDDYIPKYADTIKPLGLIKVDAQGCDLRALRGLRQTLTRLRPLIIFEFEEAAASWHGDTWDDYCHFFNVHNYRIERVRADLWDFVARPI